MRPIVVTQVRNKLFWRQPLRIRGDNVPTVDILLPCCEEGIEIIGDTIKACVVSEYPSNRFRIFVLDDGNSPQVVRLVDEIKRWSFKFSTVEVIYAARRSKSPKGKAGNLNFGLGLAAKSIPGPAEFFAVLDIDMIPEPAWLRALVPHLIQDKTLGMVNSPQRFYNVPSGSSVFTHVDAYMDVVATIQDSFNSAYCTGSGFLTRRAALDSIGGFPTESHQDDILTSLYLRANKWKIAFIQEDQQYGQSPETLRSFTNQQVRWLAGGLDMVMALHSPRLAALPPDQRRMGSALILTNMFSQITVAGSVLAIPLVLFLSTYQADHSVVSHGSPNQLRNLLGLACLARSTCFLFDYCISRSTGFRTGCLPFSDLWLQPYRIQGILVSLLRRLGVPHRWVPAGASLREVDPQGKPLGTRLKMVLWDSNAVIHLAYLIVLSVALRKASSRWDPRFLVHALDISIPLSEKTRSNVSAIAYPTSPAATILSSVLYPPFVQYVYICATQAFVPIAYAVWPDKMSDRESLLSRDEKGVAHPTDKARNLDRRVSVAGKWNSYLLVIGWYCVAAGLSFHLPI